MPQVRVNGSKANLPLKFVICKSQQCFDVDQSIDSMISNDSDFKQTNKLGDTKRLRDCFTLSSSQKQKFVKWTPKIALDLAAS